MGLTERFKSKIQNIDIYKEQSSKEILNNQENIETKQETSNIKNILVEDEPNIITENCNNFEEKNNYVENPITNNKDDDFSNTIETRIINKIRKTPYWNEYTVSKQEKMITAYLDSKIKNSQTNLDKTSKTNLIKDILVLANNR